jgi:hypothetical protein
LTKCAVHYYSGVQSFALGLASLSLLLSGGSVWAQSVTLEVMNPRGEIPPPSFNAPAERLGDLNGKKIGIYWIGKAGGDNFWDGVEELLNERHPEATTVRYEGPFDLGDARAAQLAREVDTVFYGVGD